MLCDFFRLKTFFLLFLLFSLGFFLKDFFESLNTILFFASSKEKSGIYIHLSTPILYYYEYTKMREVLKTFFVPRTHWAATNVNLVPTVATSAQLARWGGVGVFGAFWMIGTI